MYAFELKKINKRERERERERDEMRFILHLHPILRKVYYSQKKSFSPPSPHLTLHSNLSHVLNVYCMYIDRDVCGDERVEVTLNPPVPRVASTPTKKSETSISRGVEMRMKMK